MGGGGGIRTDRIQRTERVKVQEKSIKSKEIARTGKEKTCEKVKVQAV